MTVGLWLIGALAAVVLFVQTLTRASRPGGIDVTTYLAAARAVAEGANPYTLDLPSPYLYPAFLAFGMIPFSLLPATIVVAAWFAASTWALIYSLRTTLLLAYPYLRHEDLTPLLAVVLTLFFPLIQSNLRNGQVNTIVLALCIFALARHRSSRESQSAVAWGIAIAIKLMPVLIAPFFLRRRAWRELL